MTILRKPRIDKKLNKKAKDFLIKIGQFSEDDFEDDASMLYLFSQSECGDEYDECPPYAFINHTAHILSMDYIYDPEIDHVREFQRFKVRNPAHVFALNRAQYD